MKSFRVQAGAVGVTAPLAPRRTELPCGCVASRDFCSEFIRAASPAPDRFSYGMIVSVQSLLRYHRDREYRACVKGAVVLFGASNPATWLIRKLYDVRLPVRTGFSVARLVFEVAGLGDRIVMVEESVADADTLRLEPCLRDVRRLGVREITAGADPVRTCVEFIEANAPFRYCLVAVRSPWQELIADLLRARGRAKGLALCVGALNE